MTQLPLPSDLDENDDLLAAEFVMGLAEGADLRRASALMKSSPQFAALVANWQARLAPLDDEITPVTPPDLLPKINDRLFGKKPKTALFKMPDGWLGNLLGTGVMAAVSVLIMAFILQFGGGGGDGFALPQTTVLVAKDSQVQYLARLEGAQLTLTHTKGDAAQAGRSYELWVIDGDNPAVSLGLIAAELVLPAPQLAVGYVLAITDEPFGGAPGGVATGPVIAAGMFAQN